MGIVKSGGIVISVQESGETSRLVNVFTEQFGLLRVMAKGARRPESRFGAATELLTSIHGVFYMKENDSIANLSAVDLISPFSNIRNSLEKLAYASGWAEVLSANLPIAEPQRALFTGFSTALRDLEEIDDEQNEKFFWAHLLKFLSWLGYRPEFMLCSGCSIVKSDDWLFSVENGRLYCKNCSRSLRDSLFIRLDGGVARILSTYVRADRDVLEGLNASEEQMESVRNIIEGFRRYHTLPDGELKSLKFGKEVAKGKVGS